MLRLLQVTFNAKIHILGRFSCFSFENPFTSSLYYFAVRTLTLNLVHFSLKVDSKQYFEET